MTAYLGANLHHTDKRLQQSGPAVPRPRPTVTPTLGHATQPRSMGGGRRRRAPHQYSERGRGLPAPGPAPSLRRGGAGRGPRAGGGERGGGGRWSAPPPPRARAGPRPQQGAPGSEEQPAPPGRECRLLTMLLEAWPERATPPTRTRAGRGLWRGLGGRNHPPHAGGEGRPNHRGGRRGLPWARPAAGGPRPPGCSGIPSARAPDARTPRAPFCVPSAGVCARAPAAPWARAPVTAAGSPLLPRSAFSTAVPLETHTGPTCG